MSWEDQRAFSFSEALAPYQDEFYFSFGPVKRAKHAVDAIAGIAEDAVYAPRIETIDEKVTYGCGHGVLQGKVAGTIAIAMYFLYSALLRSRSLFTQLARRGK
ncbi:MAG: hypothetical protein JWQ24_5518 [Tardiphaga sp.]|nr:hypothetical protein [Tardiphaga sp.]